MNPKGEWKPGTKYDGEKDRWDLLPMNVLHQVVKVLTFGARKYADDNWQQVEHADSRYYAAMMRHMYAHRSGAYLDEESGLPHIAHALCCLIFMAWFAIKNHEGKEVNSFVDHYSIPIKLTPTTEVPK